MFLKIIYKLILLGHLLTFPLLYFAQFFFTWKNYDKKKYRHIINHHLHHHQTNNNLLAPLPTLQQELLFTRAQSSSSTYPN